MLTSFGAYNAMAPEGGPKFIPLNLDFTNGVTNRDLDFVLDEMLTIMKFIQGVFIDNSEGTQPVFLTIANSQQVIKLQPGWQGYFPIFVPSAARISIQSASDIFLPVIFYNVPLPSAQWPGGVEAAFNFTAGGQLVVSDTALAALIANQGSGDALNVNVIGTGTPVSAPADLFANPAFAAITQAFNSQFNNTDWERVRGNITGVGIASANRASGTVTNSGDFTNRNGRGLNIYTNISAGAGNVTVKVQSKDPISGLYADIPGAVTAALAGVGTYLMQIGPGLTTVANISVPALVGRVIRISQTTGGGVNVTNSVGWDFVV